MRLPLLVNPTAGCGRGMRVAERAARRFEALGVNVFLVTTGNAEETFEKTAAWATEGVWGVLVCGGDGTIHAAVNGLAGSTTALGVLPAGRGNDFARALGLYGSPEWVAERLALRLKEPPRRVDLGRVGSRYFGTVATFGLDSEVSRRVREGGSVAPRAATYLVSTVRELFRYRSRRVRLRGDFGVLERDVLLCATANTPTYGGWYRIAPKARLDDGFFHVCLVRDISRLQAFALIPRALSGTHVSHFAVETYVTSALELETEKSFPVYADGEFLAQTPCRLEVIPRSLHVFSG